jgi:hypothetical protein
MRRPRYVRDTLDLFHQRASNGVEPHLPQHSGSLTLAHTVAKSSSIFIAIIWCSMQAPQTDISKRRQITLAACVCLTFWLCWNISGIGGARIDVDGISKATMPSCKHLPEDHGTLVILRTGATEIADRIPAHISTSLRCLPQHIIFSDYAETFHGERVLDALELVDPDIVANNHDFELYRRLKQHGRAVLAQSELSDNRSKTPSSTGHVEIPGWKLDKWKFVPMVNRTFYECPDMKWYVFA